MCLLDRAGEHSVHSAFRPLESGRGLGGGEELASRLSSRPDGVVGLRWLGGSVAASVACPVRRLHRCQPGCTDCIGVIVVHLQTRNLIAEVPWECGV